MKMRRLIPIIALTFVGCGSDTAFVKAARDFHDTVGVEYAKYVDADLRLTEQDKATMKRTVEIFNLAIKAREGK